MKNIKTIFIPGLSERAKHYSSFSKYMNIHDMDWNNIKMPKGSYDTIVGFSIGADFACEYASKHKIKTLILCSLTPGIESLEKIKADKTIFIVGEREKWCLKEIKRLTKTIKSEWQIVIIPKAGHRIITNYRKTLLGIVDSLVNTRQ